MFLCRLNRGGWRRDREVTKVTMDGALNNGHHYWGSLQLAAAADRIALWQFSRPHCSALLWSLARQSLKSFCCES